MSSPIICTNHNPHTFWMFKFPVITGGAKKQPIFIEIRDDEDTCMSCNDNEKPSLISYDSGSGEPGMHVFMSLIKYRKGFDIDIYLLHENNSKRFLSNKNSEFNI